jgi:hypothetical protein
MFSRTLSRLICYKVNVGSRTIRIPFVSTEGDLHLVNDGHCKAGILQAYPQRKIKVDGKFVKIFMFDSRRPTTTR